MAESKAAGRRIHRPVSCRAHQFLESAPGLQQNGSSAAAQEADTGLVSFPHTTGPAIGPLPVKMWEPWTVGISLCIRTARSAIYSLESRVTNVGSALSDE